MSWSQPQCPECSSTTTRFESAVAFGPPDTYGVLWRCERCNVRTLELCGLGREIPEPGACLNCGDPVDASGRCRDCNIPRAAMVARVHQHCGSPPQLDAIESLAEQGRLRLAINAVDLRLETDPNDPPTLTVKAKLMTEICRPARAVPLLRRAIELGSTEPGLAISLGVALADSGDHEQALRIYEAHLETEIDPFRRALTLSNMGGCFSALGHADTAESYHRRAVEAAPDHLGPRWNLFANLFRQERHKDALEVVEQAIALSFLEPGERENMQAYRAEVLIALRRFSEALAAINESLVSDPEELARLGTRARILVHLGQHKAARTCIAKLLLLDPTSEIARRLLARLDQREPTPPRN